MDDGEHQEAIRLLTQLNEQLAAGALTPVKIQQALHLLTLEALAMREHRKDDENLGSRG
jgi:hypothetical protein